MRRLARIVLLCLGCGLCSLLYAFSQLALSLEQEAPRRQGDSAFPVRRQLSGGNARLGAVAGSAGRDERHRWSGPERYITRLLSLGREERVSSPKKGSSFIPKLGGGFFLFHERWADCWLGPKKERKARKVVPC